MADKAELVEQLEQRELTIGKLAGETETIGEPIQSYTYRCLVMIALIIVTTLLHTCTLWIGGLRRVRCSVPEPERGTEGKVQGEGQLHPTPHLREGGGTGTSCIAR